MGVNDNTIGTMRDGLNGSKELQGMLSGDIPSKGISD